MKALVGTFNQEKDLVGSFFVIVKTDGSFAALVSRQQYNDNLQQRQQGRVRGEVGDEEEAGGGEETGGEADQGAGAAVVTREAGA